MELENLFGDDEDAPAVVAPKPKSMLSETARNRVGKVQEFDPAYVRAISMQVLLSRCEPPLTNEAEFDEAQRKTYESDVAGKRPSPQKPVSLSDAAVCYDTLTRRYLRAFAIVAKPEENCCMIDTEHSGVGAVPGDTSIMRALNAKDQDGTVFDAASVDAMRRPRRLT